MKIRPFQRQDLKSILDLANAHAAFDGTVSEADFAPTNIPMNGFWVAEDAGRVVGFAYGQFKQVPDTVLERWKAKKVGCIQLMAVATDYRRRGIGESLIRKLLGEFKGAGADLVLLDCPAEAATARRLYQKIGFEDRFYGMKKRI